MQIFQLQENHIKAAACQPNISHQNIRRNRGKNILIFGERSGVGYKI